jgi:hypothetical protein
MAPRRDITPAPACGIIVERIEERIEVLRSCGPDCYKMTISELELIARQVRNAQVYLARKYAETAVGPLKRNS